MLLELFGELMNTSVSTASFSSCFDGMRRMPCRRGVVGYSAELRGIWADDSIGGGLLEMERRFDRLEIGAAGSRERPFTTRGAETFA